MKINKLLCCGKDMSQVGDTKGDDLIKKRLYKCNNCGEEKELFKLFRSGIKFYGSTTGGADIYTSDMIPKEKL
jgi:hypothetical protein